MSHPTSSDSSAAQRHSSDATAQPQHGTRNAPGLPDSVQVIGFPAGPLGTNCFILIDRSGSDESAVAGTQPAPDPATVIDPSYGAAEVIDQLAQEENFVVREVLLTHGHIDHVRDAAHFEVPVYIKEEDRVMVENPGFMLSMPQLAEMFDVAEMRVPADLRNLGATHQIAGVEFAVHHMPGHSPGSVMFRVPGLVFGGDVLFRGGVGRTDLPLSNPEDMLLSLKNLIADFDDADVVLPGHGQQTTVGEERRTNPFVQQVI